MQRPQDMALGGGLMGAGQGLARALHQVGLDAFVRLGALDQGLRPRELALEPRRAATLEEQPGGAGQQSLGRFDQVQGHLEVPLAELVTGADRLLLRFVEEA